MKKFKQHELEALVKCYTGIEEFNVTRDTQIKLVNQLKNSTSLLKKKMTENKKLKKMLKELEDKMSGDMYQTIILELDDGNSYAFTGKAIETDRDEVTIKNIKISTPAPLPEGVSFEVLDKVNEDATV